MLLLFVPLIAAAPSIVRLEVQHHQSNSALLKLGTRPAHEVSEATCDEWRSDKPQPDDTLASESLFTALYSFVVSPVLTAPRWADGWGASVDAQPPVESGVGESHCGRAPPLA